MKTNRIKSNCRIPLLLTVVFIMCSFYLKAQVEFEETIRFEADIDPDGKLEFKNRSFDTQIRTWTNNYVELQMIVQLRGPNQNDIDQTLDAIRQLGIKGRASSLTINTVFWETINSNMNRSKVLLNTGERVVLTKFKIENVLYIPKTISIDIDCKYADIEMDDIAGEAEIKIYSGKIYAGSIGSDALFDLRYSKAFVKQIPEADFKLYDSDIEIERCGNFTIESKYSKVDITRAGDMKYGKVDYNEEKFYRKVYIKENSNLFLEAFTKDAKENEHRTIGLKGYDNRLIIRN